MSIADLLTHTHLTTAQVIDLCIGVFCLGMIAGIVFRSIDWKKD